MTTCTERELLEELSTSGKCDQCGDRIGESKEYAIYCGCRHHRLCRHRWRTGDGCPVCELPQDTSCDAEKAVLVAALEGLFAYISEMAGRTAGQPKEMLPDKRLGTANRVLADRSPAAAALLAQGEALKWYADVDNWEYEHSPECEESAPRGPCIADSACRPSCAAEKDEGRRARAALAPVCGTCGDSREVAMEKSRSSALSALTMPCPDCALAPGESPSGD